MDQDDELNHVRQRLAEPLAELQPRQVDIMTTFTQFTVQTSARQVELSHSPSTPSPLPAPVSPTQHCASQSSSRAPYVSAFTFLG